METGYPVVDIEAADQHFTVTLANGIHIEGDRVILAAGLGAMTLGAKLGFDAPVFPQQGQVLITEKMPYFLKYPSGTIRQVNEGGIQIGASKANVGLDGREDVGNQCQIGPPCGGGVPPFSQSQTDPQLGGLAHHVAGWPAYLSTIDPI